MAGLRSSAMKNLSPLVFLCLLSLSPSAPVPSDLDDPDPRSFNLAPPPKPKRGAHPLDLNNGHIPQGTRVAVMLVGVFKPRVTDELTLPSIAAEVVGGLGADNIDFFIHTSPPDDSISAENVKSVYGVWLPRKIIKAMIVRPLDTQPIELLQNPVLDNIDNPPTDKDWVESNFLCKRLVEPRSLFVSQYERLRDLYGLMLSQELRHGEKYSHVVRMRTDTIWVNRWPAVLPIQLGQVAGPKYNRRGILLDHFWISGRSTAMAMFHDAPLLFHRHWDRDEVFESTQCDRVPKNHHESIDCFKAIYGINSTWPEAILTMFFRQNIENPNLADSCAITGEFIVNSRNSPLLRPCEDWGGKFSEEEDHSIAELERYLEVEMWIPWQHPKA